MRDDLNNTMSSGILYRPDIDGLRALAVLSVVMFHAFPTSFAGGFVGVDVFFVISGFLITGIIASDHEQGKFSITSFYGRRIRRIFPALILVLLSCLIMGWQILLANEFAELGLHMAAGAGFWSNLALWKESGYFDTASELKPLLHLWSLGIEEQFYILWPCLVWVVYRTTSRLLWLTGAMLLASWVWNVSTVGHDPVSAFYLPYSRAWELLVGAGLALAHRTPSKWQVRFIEQHCNTLASIGLLLIGISMVALSKESLFPGLWAVLPTSGAMLLLATEGAWINRKILSRRVMVVIGLISYPLYLWHWPLLSFGRIVENGELPVFGRVLLILLATLLSALTYRYVEIFFRHKGRAATLSLMTMMIVFGLLGLNVYMRDGLEFRYRKLIELPAEMRRDFTKWEDKGMYPEGNCTPNFVYPNASICLQSQAGKRPTTVVFGDSHAFHAYWGIAKAFADDKHVVKLVGRGGCNFALYRQDEDCIRTFDAQVDWMLADPVVQTVFVIHRLVIQNDSSKVDQLDYQQRLESTLDRLIRQGKQVVYVFPVPELRFNPRLCASALPFGRKVDATNCEFDLARERDLQKVERALVTRWRERHPALEVFDPADILCPQERCRAVVNGSALWMDDNHVTETGSYLIGQTMAEAIRLR